MRIQPSLLKQLSCSLISLTILVIPASDNYSLRQLDIGGSTSTGQSENYSYQGIVTDQGLPLSGTAYNGGLGIGFTQMANTPKAPSLSNPANYYNQLQAIIDPSGNPSDALFALAISSDDFTTTQYVKADQAIGSSLTFSDYLSYQDWGGSSGFNILGLQPGTTYKLKVKAMHGDLTESPFGPAASATTVNPNLSFDIDIAPTDTSTSPPYQLQIGNLTPGSITTSNDKAWFSLQTNAQNGANIYIASSGNGLASPSKSYTLPSFETITNLSSTNQGFGPRANSVQGGDMQFTPSYDLTGNNIGPLTNTFNKLLSTNNPVTSGRASILFLAKASNQTPASSDYQEVITIVAAADY